MDKMLNSVFDISNRNLLLIEAGQEIIEFLKNIRNKKVRTNTNNKSFKNLVIGLGITNFGDSLFMIAAPIMIYAQTQSDIYVSISASAAVFTMLFGFL